MWVSELFYSVQGEGKLTGVPSYSIRLAGCNLRCTWCDTKYASWAPEGDHELRRRKSSRKLGGLPRGARGGDRW